MTGGPSRGRPHLVVQLKFDWRFDPSQDAFVSSRGRVVAPHKALPRGSRVVHMVPELATEDPRELNQDERDLTRYVHVMLPKRADVSQLLDTVGAWICVADVRLPPEISLPG